MTWGNPPVFKSDPPKKGRLIQPEDIAGDSESSQQKALFVWAALNVSKYPQLAFMFAIPNGGLRDVRTATTLKAEGVKSGVPDIFLPASYKNSRFDIATVYCGCFIEMKIEKYRNHKNGGCSEAQIEFMEYAANAGYYRKVCYNWIEARDTLIAYLEGKL